MVQRKNTPRLGWAAAALAAAALVSGCSHSEPAAPASAPAAVVPASMPTESTAASGTSAAAPRDPHVSPMSAEDQQMMKQNDEKDKALGAPP